MPLLSLKNDCQPLLFKLEHPREVWILNASKSLING